MKFINSEIFSSFSLNFASEINRIIFIDTSILKDTFFQNFFGLSSNDGLLLIVNSLFLGILLSYILYYTFSNIIYSNVDSPYTFIIRSIIFIACANSSLWICEKIIDLFSIITNLIFSIGNNLSNTTISFSNFIENYNLLTSYDSASISDNLFTFLSNTLLIILLIVYSIRYFICKILILISPFAFISLINKKFDTIFCSWLNLFLNLLFTQIFISLVLVLSFSFNFISGDIISYCNYISIVIIILLGQYFSKRIFSFVKKLSFTIDK